MKKIQDVMSQIISDLKEVYGELSLPYAERILGYVCNCTRETLYLSPEKILDNNSLDRINKIIERCKKNEPLEYIMGTAFFFNRDFIVTNDILIPRPDTEILVEEILKNEKGRNLFFLELGTGSGIISCILTEGNIGWDGIATDISLPAVKVAKNNCKSHNMRLICGDLFYHIKPMKQFDFMVGNLPYIKSKDIPLLDKSVRDFEPLIALDGGEDGLFFYRKISEEGWKYLKKEGRLYLEIGDELKQDLEKIFASSPWKNIKFIKDNSSRYRVITVLCES